MDEVEVATEDEWAALGIGANNVGEPMEGLLGLGITERVGSPEAMMIHNGQAILESDNLDVKIIAWHRCSAEDHIGDEMPMDKLAALLHEGYAAQDHVPYLEVAVGHHTLPVGREEYMRQTTSLGNLRSIKTKLGEMPGGICGVHNLLEADDIGVMTLEEAA